MIKIKETSSNIVILQTVIDAFHKEIEKSISRNETKENVCFG